MRKLNVRKYMRNIKDNAVQGRLSEKVFNAKNYCTKYFRDEIFAIYGTFFPLYNEHAVAKVLQGTCTKSLKIHRGRSTRFTLGEQMRVVIPGSLS